jgi:uncharacterized membrane protein
MTKRRNSSSNAENEIIMKNTVMKLLWNNVFSENNESILWCGKSQNDERNNEKWNNVIIIVMMMGKIWKEESSNESIEEMTSNEISIIKWLVAIISNY